MSYQLALCARVVRTGEMTKVLNYGITPDDFTTTEGRAFWELILGYFTQQQTRGSVITQEMLQNWFKEVMLYDHMPQMTLDALCYEVRKERIKVRANSYMLELSDELNVVTADPAGALARHHKKVSDLIALGTVANSDVSAQQGMEAVQRRLAQAKAGIDNSVMQWPWDALQTATFGVQPDDYIVFYGRPKSMKSWVLCKLIAHAFENDKKVLVYTKEMTPENVYMRTYACLLRMAYQDLREAVSGAGKGLTPEQEHSLHELDVCIASDPRLASLMTVLSGRDVPSGGDTVAWLNSKIEQYKPDIMFVDGIYLLSDQRKATSDHTRVMNISRDLRQMNLATRVPLITTMQANRKAAGHNDANLDEIAYSDALSQDATIAARVINDKGSPTISIVMGGSREFELRGFRIHGVPASNFSYHSILTEKDIMDAAEQDAKEAAEKKKKAAAKPAANGKSTKKLTEDALLEEQMQNAANGMSMQ